METLSRQVLRITRHSFGSTWLPLVSSGSYFTLHLTQLYTPSSASCPSVDESTVPKHPCAAAGRAGRYQVGCSELPSSSSEYPSHPQQSTLRIAFEKFKFKCFPFQTVLMSIQTCGVNCSHVNTTDKL